MTGQATIERISYSLSTPNDLLFSPFQRIEVYRDTSGVLTDITDSDVFTVVVAWAGFSLTRHYNVPWTASNGYAVIFPDFDGLGFSGLYSAGNQASVKVYFGEGATDLLAEGYMLVASEPGTVNARHVMPFGAECGFIVDWLTADGTLVSCPVVATSTQAQRKNNGYSPMQTFATRQGRCTIYRDGATVAKTVNFEAVAQPSGEEALMSTFGETPFVELRDADGLVLFDSLTPGSFSFKHGVKQFTFSATNVRHRQEA